MLFGKNRLGPNVYSTYLSYVELFKKYFYIYFKNKVINLNFDLNI